MKAAAGIYTRILLPEAAGVADAGMFDMQKAMLDATPDCIKVVDTSGSLKMMNRAGCLALNVPTDSDFGMPWLSLLPPDVRAAGEVALAQARQGLPSRFPGKSISDGQVTFWDNLLTPLLDTAGNVVSILCISRDITETTVLEQQLQKAIERERMLAREMRHRIKNLLTVVAGFIHFSKREAASKPGASSAIDLLSAKLEALSRASDAVFEAEGTYENADKSITISTIVHSVMKPYIEACRLSGDDISVYCSTIASFTLVLHELATNSVKYGAFSRDEGDVAINWLVSDGNVTLTWAENGGPKVVNPPQNYGFGTEMIDRVAQSIGGTIVRTWEEDGLIIQLSFPLSAVGPAAENS